MEILKFGCMVEFFIYQANINSMLRKVKLIRTQPLEYKPAKFMFWELSNSEKQKIMTSKEKLTKIVKEYFGQNAPETYQHKSIIIKNLMRDHLEAAPEALDAMLALFDLTIMEAQEAILEKVESKVSAMKNFL